MALFLQWKQMEDMTMMIDSYNLLALKAVPITLLIDEAGIIRHRNPSRDDLQKFINSPPAEVGSAPEAPRPYNPVSQRAPLRNTLINLTDRERSLRSHAADKFEELARTNFQLGVGYRKNYDTGFGQIDDFKHAVTYWKKALLLDPSNYIARRRVQQYGPQLDKPYPFYNWIAQARQEITARGETPLPLLVEPRGAEITLPEKNLPKTKTPPHPDPENKLPQDEQRLFNHIVVFVPHTDQKTEAYRVFVDMKPFHQGTKWNDEAGPTTLRPVAPPNWTVHPEVIEFTPVKGTPANANRSIEFELRRSKPADPFVETFPPTLSLQFFLNVCHGEPEVCQFLRFDIDHEIPNWKAKVPPPPRPRR